MVKIIGLIVGHAKPFHHGDGGAIHRCGKRHDFGQTQHLKSVTEGLLCSFRGISFATKGRGQPPSDFYRRGEMGLKRRNVETNKPDKSTRDFFFHRPEAKAVGAVVGF